MFLDLDDALAVLNANSSPIEFLVSQGELESGGDEEGMGGVRFHTALRLRDLISGAQVKGLKAAAFSEFVSGGVDCGTRVPARARVRTSPVGGA